MSAPPSSRVARLGRFRKRQPLLTWASAFLVALLGLLPLVFLVDQASGLGWTRAVHVLWRPRVRMLLVNTIELSSAVTVGSAILGVAVAWCLERTHLPGRRVWAVLVVLPVTIPEFVGASGWVSIFPSLEGFPAAVLVMTLALYPLVYLPVAGALRGLDPALEETGRSLGLGTWGVFRRVILPQLRPAVLGGCLVVSLYLLAEYGSFALVRYATFTTEIFTEYRLGLDPAAAAALSLVLVALCAALVTGELFARGKARYSRIGLGAPRAARKQRLGKGAFPVVGGLAALVVLSLGVPLGALGYWLIRGSSTTLPSSSILSAAAHTLGYGIAAALLTTTLALPVAHLAVRRRSWLSTSIERSTYVARALPGLVVGLAFIYFCIRFARPLYQTSTVVILAYAVMFIPLALVAVQSALAQSPPRLEEVGRSLGRSPFVVFFRVTLPLIGPGLAAALALVFLSSVHELTATLLLRPTGVETLTTQFWVYTSSLAYGAAAPYAAVLVAISAIPAYLLVRRIDALGSVGAE